MKDERKVLAQLDRQLVFTCEGQRKCTRVATHLVHIHVVSNCKRPRANVDANGDAVYFMCPACKAAAELRLTEVLDDLFGDEDETAFEAIESEGIVCGTCDRMINGLEDIWQAEELGHL